MRHHTHPCALCGKPIACYDDLERNDGIPEVVCPSFHLPNGEHAAFACEDCINDRGATPDGPGSEFERLVDALNGFTENALVRHYDATSEETLIECRLCGEWEGHKAGCPVPVIEKWLV